MTKLLQLTGLQTYIGPLTRTGQGEECAVVKKGQVCRMDDKEANSAMTGNNIDREGQPVPYFKDVTATFDGEPDFDFSKKVEVKKAAEPDGNANKDTDDKGSADTGNQTTSAQTAAPRTQRVPAKSAK